MLIQETRQCAISDGIYLLAQSNSSIKDYFLYIPTLLEDCTELERKSAQSMDRYLLIN